MKELPIFNNNLKDLQNAMSDNISTSVFGLSFGEKALFLCSQKRQIVYITGNISNAIKLDEEMQSFGKKSKIMLGTDINNFSLNQQTLSDNTINDIETLYSLSKNKLDCLILSPSVLMQKFFPKSEYQKSILSVKANQKIDQNTFIKSLIKIGYKRVDSLSFKGEFSVKGDTISIYDYISQNPIKVEFFDDVIESIYHFDFDTFKKTKEIKSFDIVPNFMINFDFDTKSQLLEMITKDFEKSLKQLDANKQIKLKTNFEEFKVNFEAENFSYIQNWLMAYLQGVSIIDYLNDDAIVVFDDVKYIYDKIKQDFEQFESISKSLQESGEVLCSLKGFYIPFDKVFDIKNTKLSFQQITTSNRIFEPQKVLSFKASAETNYHGNFDLLAEDLKYYLEYENKVIIFAGTQELANYLSNFLKSKNLAMEFYDEQSTNIKYDVIYISKQNIPYGAIFVEDKFVVIGTNELQKKKVQKKVVESVKKEEFTLPKAGDYVVHESFGIALCEGVQRLKFSNYEKDYIVLKYDGGDKLYMPTEQIGLISAYVSTGKTPKLNKLGSRDFENTKAKVKKNLKELAFDLVQLYREREEAKGYKYEIDKKLLREFENTFPYEETDDQTSAISDIMTDMKSGKIMDRIVCGDVGYGKTEVALRAAFVAAHNNKQTCFLAPTTILAEQHYNTAKARLENFGITVECLNRFRTKAEQKQIIERLKKGQIDIICGTHRLLSSDVVFKDLGLLILDEEQRFGVGDKEKIKRLKSNIDVLTLSATPIPRTLHMGLVGIRDISVIATAPKGRLSVQTYVAEYNDTMILSAINRELGRDGQVLIVFNRVEHIYEFAHHIRSLLGNDIAIGVAHGQMETTELENQIMDLYKGKTKVLISTTLIENGIDLPSANTLIVVDADNLGLSQLYQLKGRVGRSKNLGYAYFLYKRDKALTEDAYKRLNAIMEFTELGSGFKIAMKDLEIRGCGNILGAEQSGHMAKVGYDMYCKILKEAVAEIKGQKQKQYKDIKLDVATNCYIPENYIDGSENRFRIYNNLKQIDCKQKREKVLLEIENLYGKVPDEINNLSSVALLRNLAREFDVKRISIDRQRCQAEFYDKESMLNKTISQTLKNLGIKVYYSPTGAIMNFMLSEYSVKKKLEILCDVFETSFDLIKNNNK